MAAKDALSANNLAWERLVVESALGFGYMYKNCNFSMKLLKMFHKQFLSVFHLIMWLSQPDFSIWLAIYGLKLFHKVWTVRKLCLLILGGETVRRWGVVGDPQVSWGWTVGPQALTVCLTISPPPLVLPQFWSYLPWSTHQCQADLGSMALNIRNHEVNKPLFYLASSIFNRNNNNKISRVWQKITEEWDC